MRTAAATTVAALALSSVLVAGPQAPGGVSPGAPTEFEPSASACPLFSWAMAGETAGYELIVVAVEKRLAASPTADRTVIDVRLPGGARAWGPPPGQCLDLGARYAWSVRAVAEEGAGAWSTPLLFRVSPPSALAVREATEVLRTWLAVTGGEAAPEFAEVPATGADEEVAAITIAPDVTGISALFETLGGPEVALGVHGISYSATAASAGAVGEARATSGIVAAVIGQVASPSGTAGAFDNTGGGSVLETRVGASIAVQMDGNGTVTAPIFSGKGGGLTGVTDLACSECVGSLEIGDGSVAAADLAAASVGAAKIEADAVGADELATNAVGVGDITAGAVGSAEIAAESVGSAELAEGAVGASEIASGAVIQGKIDGGAVTRGKLQGLEKMVRSIHPDCPGAGKPTRELRCSSLVCQTIPTIQYLDCNGGCTASVPELCDNADKGLLLDPNMDL